MKNVILGVLLCILASLAHAAGSHPMCDSASELATTVMKARQKGVAMSKAMEVVDTSYAKLPAARKLWEQVVIEAYEEPRYSTDAMQQRAIQDFRDKVYLACVKTQANDP